MYLKHLLYLYLSFLEMEEGKRLSPFKAKGKRHEEFV